MDSSRAFFVVKQGERLGDRLVLRFPATDEEIVERLSNNGITDIPSNITIGYYRQLPDLEYLQLAEPIGAWCFMPVNTPSAMSLLDCPIILDRIGYDLLNRLNQI